MRARIIRRSVSISQQVLQLGQLYLGLGIGRGGPLGKDVEDEPRTVHDLDAELFFEVSGLRGREFVVENDDADLAVGQILLDLLQFPATDKGALVGIGQLLGKGGYGLQTGRLGQKAQFIEVLLYFAYLLPVTNDGDQNDFFVLLLCDLLVQFSFLHTPINKAAGMDIRPPTNLRFFAERTYSD